MDPLTLLQSAKTNAEKHMATVNDNVLKLESQKQLLEDQLQEIEGSLDIIIDLKSTVANLLRMSVSAALPSVEEEKEDDEELPAFILNVVTAAARN